MPNKTRPWLRFIEGTEGGQANPAGNTNADHGQAPDSQGTTDSDDVSAEDWKAKYESMKGHARTWETRAKENQEAAAELEKIREAEKTEVQKYADRVSQL